MTVPDEERGLAPPSQLDEAALQQAEEHQAEEPLVWSQAKQTWISAGNQDNDDEEYSTPNSTSIVGNGHAGGKRPVRAVSDAFSDSREPIYVAFEDEDPDNPFEWSRRKKWIITGVGAWLTTLGMESSHHLPFPV